MKKFSIRRRALDARHRAYALREMKHDAVEKIFNETIANEVYSFRWNTMDFEDENGKGVGMNIWFGKAQTYTLKPAPIKKATFRQRIRILLTGEIPAVLELESSK